MYAAMSDYHYAICHQFVHLFSTFFSILIVVHSFSTLIALGDVDLCFSLMLVRQANAVEEETR